MVEPLGAGAATCFRATRGGTTVRVLLLIGFAAQAICIAGPAATDNRVFGCRVGLDWADTSIGKGFGIAITGVPQGTRSAARTSRPCWRVGTVHVMDAIGSGLRVRRAAPGTASSRLRDVADCAIIAHARLDLPEDH